MNDAARNEAANSLPSPDDLEQTLQRLVRRVGMMMQAEKCVFLLHDRDRNLLVARRPALGLSSAEVRTLHVPMESGFSGRVFDSDTPEIVNDIAAQNSFDQEWMQRIDARELIVYPLTIERPDEQNRAVERVPVGVLYVINKRGEENFTPDDIKTLSAMARQVAAVIADAQIYLRLTEEKEQLQATFQSLLAAMVMIDSSGQVSLFNTAAAQMLHVDADDAMGTHYSKVFSSLQINELFRAALEDGIEQHAEVELTTIEGVFDGTQPRIFQTQTAFVHGERDGVPIVLGVVAIFNDITEIRNVERMKTAFVSTVSHELRTPLTSIKGFIATLLQDEDDYFGPEERREFYEIIDSECDRLRRLIEDLLNVSRIESGRSLQLHTKMFDPVRAAEGVLQAQRAYSDKHALKLDADFEVPQIEGDEDKFDQILTNLVSNAIKYSPKGGLVKIAMSCDDMMLKVSVSDQGIGIPADKLSRIFEKFERIDNRDTRQAGGTGIGLFLVKHLVELHGGVISAHSENNSGSTFTFEIPVRAVKSSTIEL